MKIADKMGVDGVKIWDASRAAFMANLDLEYDKADLIPEVTRELKKGGRDQRRFGAGWYNLQRGGQFR